MGTATSRPAAVLALLAFVLGGCGGGSRGATGTAGAGSAPRAAAGGELPAGWSTIAVPGGARLVYPPGWRSQRGDPGTATAALRDPRGGYLGYLNLTPRQGGETLADFAAYRLAHNREEGQRHVRRLPPGRTPLFPTGAAACVRDAYTTATGAAYVELACLRGAGGGRWVLIAAAPPRRWAAEHATLERALAASGTA
jgi:hypothetical protein